MNEGLLEQLRKLMTGPRAEGKGFPETWYRIRSWFWKQNEQRLTELVNQLDEELLKELEKFFSVDDYWQVVKYYKITEDTTLTYPTKDFYFVGTFRPLTSMVVESPKFGNYFFDASRYEYKWGRQNFYLMRKSEREFWIISHPVENDLLNDKVIKRIFNRYLRKHPEHDYFIPKNLKNTLVEQLRFRGIDLVPVLEEIIDILHSVEEWFRKVWEEPRKVKVEHYVITLDRIVARPGGLELLQKFLSHPGMKKQINEWKELGIVDEKFNLSQVFTLGVLNPKYQHLPLDTKYFEDLEPQLLELFNNG